MQTLKTLSVICFIGLLTVQSAAAIDELAGPGRGPKGPAGRPGMGEMFKELNLTEDQKQALKALHEKNRASGGKPPPQEIGERVKKINDLAFEGATEAEISAEVDQLKEKYIEMSKKAAEFRAILTPEQQARMKEIRAKRAEQWRQRKEEFGEKSREHMRGEGGPQEGFRRGEGGGSQGRRGAEGRGLQGAEPR